MSASWAMRASRPSLDVASINPILFLHALHTLHPWEKDLNRVYLTCVLECYTQTKPASPMNIVYVLGPVNCDTNLV